MLFWLPFTDVYASETVTQLPRNVRPTHYEVNLQPDAEKLQFDGKVIINIEVLASSRKIVLNAADLSFSNAELTAEKGAETFKVAKLSVDNVQQTVSLTFEKFIPIGQYQLALTYSGKIGSQAAGLFALDYDTLDGHKRALYTQFENSDARRVIPSWDEPAYKATFKLSVLIPQGQVAVSNMPVAEVRDVDPGHHLVHFMISPKMSTYLLFFGLGDFDRASVKAGDVEIGVVAKKGGTGQAAFVLESTQNILTEYNEYFGTPYPLPKLDNVAAPGSSQFFSAMENWGAIFTFEHAMLLDPAIATQADRQRAFVIAAHETAHQWFGNLVTMVWWDDLWLNESFASWMESRTTILLHPEWNTLLSAISVRERAMDLDAYATTHPIVQPVKTVEQVHQAFDAITYQKGQSVIRMLEAYVGEQNWRTGIQHYMHDYRYSNAVSGDLWHALEAAGGKPITAIANDFTLQQGVPLIRVKQAVCTNGVTKLLLHQGEFSKEEVSAKKPQFWRVPVLARILTATENVGGLVNGDKATLSLPGCGPVIVNAGQTGYFRTLYSPELYKQLVKDFATLPAIDQLGILTDTWALGTAGLQPLSDFLDLIQTTPLSADPQLWERITSILLSVDDYYRENPSRRALFRSYAISRLNPLFKQVGWLAQAGEADAVAILRNDLITTLGNLGDDAVVTEARRRYQAQQQDANAVPGPLRKAILGVVAKHADVETWEQMHAQSIAEKTPLIKDLWFNLLSSSLDKRLAQRALDLALTAEPGSTTSASMISTVSYSHPDLAFDYALAHYQEVLEKVDGPSHSRFFAALGQRSFAENMIAKVKAYTARYLAVDSRRSADTAVATIAYRIKVHNKRLVAIDQWLQKNPLK
jgi:aminopeptidase N